MTPIAPISALDATFLLGESQANPAHFTALLVFELPNTAGDDYVRRVHDRIVAERTVHPVFRRRAAWRRGRPVWESVDDVDSTGHVRYLRLPEPGGRRELDDAIARSRTTLLDRRRPLWRADVIDGMAGRRFALNLVVHHSLIDGIGLVRLLQNCLSADPAANDCVALWNAPEQPLPAAVSHRADGSLRRDLRTVRTAVRADRSLMTPYPNVKVGAGAGGFGDGMAIRSWEFRRFDAIRRAHRGVSINDVVVAACGGALRSYLLDLGALPDASLKAMVPIATRTADQADSGGNAVGAIVADLGTDRADPVERLEAVRASMTSGKSLFRSVGDGSALAWSAATMSPIYYNRIAGPRRTDRRRRFSTVVSNTPAPREQLYLNGAKLVGLHPVGLVTKGLDLNVALCNTADSMGFGILTSMPSAQRFSDHYERALQELTP